LYAAFYLIPDLLASTELAGHLTARPSFDVTATTVLGVPGLALPAAVVCINGGPHVITYRTGEARGATICVPFDNQPAVPGGIHRPPGPSDRERVLRSIRTFTPGLADTLNRVDRVFWYSCQKLIPTGAAARPNWRNNVFTTVAPGLHVAYAGKFTTAPMLAGDITRHLAAGRPGTPLPPGRGTVQVADQPYRADGLRVPPPALPSDPPATQRLAPA
jgi:hypothetical protein